MRFPRRSLTIGLSLLIAVLLAPATLAATRTFCLVGVGDGTGWSWTLRDPDSMETCADQSVQGLVGSADQVADRFVASINNNCSSASGGGGLQVTSARLNAAELARVCGAGFIAGFRAWGGGNSPLEMFVADFGTNALTDPSSCGVPDAPGFCNFNPDISAAPPFQGGGQGAAAIPALQPWHYVAIVVLIGLAGAVLMWRRLA
jgi:hypothetical protein